MSPSRIILSSITLACMTGSDWPIRALAIDPSEPTSLTQRDESKRTSDPASASDRPQRETDQALVKRQQDTDTAQGSGDSPEPSPATRKNPRPLTVSAQQEAEILEFVEKQQPKLLKLLAFMRERRQPQYQQALRETWRSMQRLENLAERDQELHAIELKLWRVRSETRLLAGQISAAKSEQAQSSMEQRLERLLEQELAYSLERVKQLRARTAKQLAQYDAQIEELEAHHEELISKSLKQWRNRIARQSTSSRQRGPSDNPASNDNRTTPSADENPSARGPTR